MSEEKGKGKVKWFNSEKGYGFISPDSGEKDLFFHKSNVENLEHNLENDEVVEFEESMGKKGKEAINIRTISQ